ncbi:glutamine-rich protein 2-like isoform X1 [Tamandua tetradactyla]|uniref:glutamine-rich protein 2-like isoform X1 n=1 Tax=Tamandua tetradactyla TaxID=48850 RepID=UPI0040546702
MDQSVWAQAGTDQHGLAQPGAYRPDLVQPGIYPPGLLQPDAYQPGLVQAGTYPRGLVQAGAYPRGLVQPDVYSHGRVESGADKYKLVQPGMDQHGLAQPGADQHGLAQPGADQHGLAQPGADQHTLAQPGADQDGLVQPGTDQHGLAQPDADQHALVQPGAGQHGLVQPGTDQQHDTDQHALVQHSAGQHGLVQPSEDQHGLVHPSADQHGLVQPGMAQHGLVQPGVAQHGLVQPGMVQRGLVQPGMVQRGLVQPGMVQRGFLQPSADQHGLVPGRINQQVLTPLRPELRGYPPQHIDSRSLISSRPYQQGLVTPGRDQYIQASLLVANQQFASPRIDEESLVPPEMYQPGLVQHGIDQHGLRPLHTGLGFTHPDQQQVVSPGLGQHGQEDSGPEDHGSRHPSTDQLHQEGSASYGIDQPQFPAQTGSSQDSTFVYKTSSEKMEAQGERHDSLDKLAPNFPIAVETFRLMGELVGLYLELKEQMKDLDEEQAGHTDLEKIKYLLALLVEKTLPPDLPEHLKSIKTLAKEVRQEKAKLDRLQRILEGEGLRETGKEMKAGQLSLQLGILRVTMADIEKELAELRESQERGKVTMEHSVSEASLYLQDQLDKLRTIIESMLASSSTLLTLSMPPSKTHPTLRPGQIDPEATCPACSLDLSHQVSTLVQRYEQLQDMVNNLAASRPSKKAKLQSQDEELLGRVQSAILQVQGDCERLAVTTSGLIADHRQKQRDINVLYQGLEKLEREKANREHLETEIDVKADKSALAAKVSRVQFDATTEQLNHMMRELVARMSGREQDWQTMLDKLLAAMDSKLDRLELEPVKQLLEDRWKSLRQQLKERSPLYQADEAAAMRRQLLAHFHCLSCDRPLETPLTGQVIPAMPVGPGLPGHRSTRPYTVFELEQVRQQSRNLKLGGPLPRGDLSQMERSVGRLRSAHSKMLTAIEKVQIHFGGSVKASSQMIHELLQAQCLGPPCYRRMTDMADYSYSSVPRRCGGSHTLTYPYRRNRLQHLSPGLLPAEETQAAMKHDEVDILGLDGHIYKGRMDTRLPGIVCKDTPGLAKHKAKQSRPHGHRQQSLSDNHQLLSRPQSAQLLAGNNPASLRQHKDRPVSSEVLLSQPNVAHPPSPTEMTTLTARNPPALNMHLDVPPREGLEDPTRGPRSNTAH